MHRVGRIVPPYLPLPDAVTWSPCTPCGPDGLPLTDEEREKLKAEQLLLEEEREARMADMTRRQAELDRKILEEDVAVMKKLGVVAWKSIALQTGATKIEFKHEGE